MTWHFALDVMEDTELGPSLYYHNVNQKMHTIHQNHNSTMIYKLLGLQFWAWLDRHHGVHTCIKQSFNLIIISII